MTKGQRQAVVLRQLAALAESGRVLFASVTLAGDATLTEDVATWMGVTATDAEIGVMNRGDGWMVAVLPQRSAK